MCRSRNKLYVFVPKGVFGRVDFSEDGKKMRENEKEKLFRRRLVERKREGKMIVEPIKKFSP